MRSYLQNKAAFILRLLCVPIYWQYKTAFTARYFPSSILFVFFLFCNVRELLKRVISIPQFSLYSHVFGN